MWRIPCKVKAKCLFSFYFQPLENHTLQKLKLSICEPFIFLVSGEHPAPTLPNFFPQSPNIFWEALLLKEKGKGLTCKMHISSVMISWKNLTLNPLECKLHSYYFILYNNRTGNNWRLWSVGDNDRSSKCFRSNAVLCISFTWQMIKTHMIRLWGVESRNVSDQIAFCEFHSFLVEVQLNISDICVAHA